MEEIKGKKITELTPDDLVTGVELIPVSDNGVTKFISVKQLLDSVVNTSTQHEEVQNKAIEENKEVINKTAESVEEIKETLKTISVEKTDVWETFKP